MTSTPGIALGILTADCAPVLLADRQAGVIGAAHAGWRGAFSGIVEATVAAMTDLGATAENIAAGVGVCIGPRSYEVGPEFRARFVEANQDNDRFFARAERQSQAGQHWMFDLPAYVADRCAQAGLTTVTTLERDSHTEPDNFFSYRRATLAGEVDYGRNLSAIAMPDSRTKT